MILHPKKLKTSQGIPNLNGFVYGKPDQRMQTQNLPEKEKSTTNSRRYGMEKYKVRFEENPYINNLSSISSPSINVGLDLSPQTAQHMQNSFESAKGRRQDRVNENKLEEKNPSKNVRQSLGSGIPGLNTLSFNTPLTKSSVYDTYPKMISRNYPNGQHLDESSNRNQRNGKLRLALQKVSSVFNL